MMIHLFVNLDQIKSWHWQYLVQFHFHKEWRGCYQASNPMKKNGIKFTKAKKLFESLNSNQSIQDLRDKWLERRDKH